ncbi:MAG: hypothetical protein MPJ50_12350 [Pirellulales bacterium]|nr:hypothetical protein [Pirellulales bacterium]
MKVKLTFETDKPEERDRGTCINVYIGGAMIQSIDGRDEPPEVVLENVTDASPIKITRRFNVIPHEAISGATIENATQR